MPSNPEVAMWKLWMQVSISKMLPNLDCWVKRIAVIFFCQVCLEWAQTLPNMTALSVVWQWVASISTGRVPFSIFSRPLAMLFSRWVHRKKEVFKKTHKHLSGTMQPLDHGFSWHFLSEWRNPSEQIAIVYSRLLTYQLNILGDFFRAVSTEAVQ